MTILPRSVERGVAPDRPTAEWPRCSLRIVRPVAPTAPQKCESRVGIPSAAKTTRRYEERGHAGDLQGRQCVAAVHEDGQYAAAVRLNARQDRSSRKS